MSDAPETIWAWTADGRNAWSGPGGYHVTGLSAEYTRADLTIRRDDPALVAMVDALSNIIDQSKVKYFDLSDARRMTKTARDALSTIDFTPTTD